VRRRIHWGSCEGGKSGQGARTGSRSGTSRRRKKGASEAARRGVGVRGEEEEREKGQRQDSRHRSWHNKRQADAYGGTTRLGAVRAGHAKRDRWTGTYRAVLLNLLAKNALHGKRLNGGLDGIWDNKENANIVSAHPWESRLGHDRLTECPCPQCCSSEARHTLGRDNQPSGTAAAYATKTKINLSAKRTILEKNATKEFAKGPLNSPRLDQPTAQRRPQKWPSPKLGWQ
jgi:hypothetical protein